MSLAETVHSAGALRLSGHACGARWLSVGAERVSLVYTPARLRSKPTHSRRALQVLAFNYPGQADTTFAPSCLPTNEWVAERMHELLRHVEGCGHMLLSSSPFHILAIGNGAAIATAFIHK